MCGAIWPSCGGALDQSIKAINRARGGDTPIPYCLNKVASPNAGQPFTALQHYGDEKNTLLFHAGARWRDGGEVWASQWVVLACNVCLELPSVRYDRWDTSGNVCRKVRVMLCSPGRADRLVLGSARVLSATTLYFVVPLFWWRESGAADKMKGRVRVKFLVYSFPSLL